MPHIPSSSDNTTIAMPISMHSHSGEFCGHATNTLLEVVERAKSLGMSTFALTEHMPRDEDSDLYPEEVG